MAIGPQGFIPDYAQQQAMQGRQAPVGSRIGKHIMGGGLAALQGGLGAYGTQQGLMQQPQQMQQNPQESLPSYGQQQSNQNMMGSNQFSASPQQNQLSALIQAMTAQKANQIMGRGQMSAPAPDQLRQQAFQASNEQMSDQGPPQWKLGPQFAFEQFTSPAMLSALGELGGEALAETDETLPWYKQLAHGGGKVLQGAAPLLGMLGPLGLLGGAAAGLAGYGLQQI